ncbi:MAG: radical SAM protein [Clostridiales bacterium]|nr:radical SAM protein [Clostridiales bacterium]MBE5810080.1 radical SAM protein [Clostridiales bacterium]
MKICFINPPFKAEYGKFSRESRSPSIGHSGVLYYPLWLIYAAAVAKKNGFEVAFIDAPAKQMTKEQTLERIANEAADAALFVFDTSTPSIYSDVDFAATVKDTYPKAFTMLVGTHPSATPDETMQINEKVDGLARREYDYIVRDLAIALRDGTDLAEVRGLTYRKDGRVIHNTDAEHITELDEIPWAAEFIKEYLCVTDYVFPAAAFPSVQMFTGRGCPAQCNFCVYPQTLHGHRYRLRTPENVVGEIEYILGNFPEVKEIVFEDDTFTINKARVTEICNLLIEKGIHKKIRWLCNARVNLDYDTMVLMKRAGCHLIIPGIESVNQQILKNIKKGTTVEQIEKYISNAHKAGLMIHACYMVGNEGETRETMEATLAAAMRFKTDTAQFFPLIPYPGTGAYEWAKGNGYINGKYDEYVHEDGTLNCIINTPALKAEDLVEFCSYARKKYYLRPWYIAHRIWRGLNDFEDLKRSLKAFSKLKKTLFK